MHPYLPARRLPALLLSACLLIPAISRAQGYAEGIGLSYELLPLKLASDSGGSFRGDVYRANIIVPVAADTSHAVLAGLNLETLRFSGNRPGFAVRNVYGIMPVLGYRQRLSPRTELTALALPALNSDLRDVRGADVTWGGVLRAAYRASARRVYRLTVGYRQQFYGPQYVLLLGLDWQLGQRWRLFGDLPTTFTASYAATPKVTVGFNLIGLNTAYRLLNNDEYFQYQQAHYGLFAETYLGAHWAVRGTAAYAGIRRLDVFAKDDQRPATIDYIGLGNAPMPFNPRLEKGLAFRLALSYRVAAP